jgi:hypothetical protein
MKKIILLAVLVSAAFTSVAAQAIRGQSLNGVTGLFSIPSGRIGWESSGNIALDAGYRAIINRDAGVSHIPAITASFFNWVELSAAFDIQPKVYDQNNNDLLFGVKIKFPSGMNTSVAFGGSVQLLNFIDDFRYFAYQPYVAVTYGGTFFSMPAETTIVLGKTFYSKRENNSSIDFGMGFDLVLLAGIFGNSVHWIMDFANFSYSDNAWPNYSYYDSGPAWFRGVASVGFRIDLSTIPALDKYKFLVDLICNDIFDTGQRSFTVGAVFGLSFL